MKFAILLVLILFGCVIGTFGLRSFRLEDYCHEDGLPTRRNDLSMISEDIYAGQLNFTFKASLPGDYRCTAIVGSNGFDRDRLAFHFTAFDLGDNCGPGESWVSVMEGDLTIDPKPIYGLPERLCGRSFVYFSSEYTTEWRHLMVRYQANNPPVGSGFNIVFKHFSDPPCASYQYRCDNSRCIHNSQKCNGNNPCGDNSDCKTYLSGGAITGIIIGGSAGVGVLALLYKCLPSLLKSDSTEDNRNRDERQPDRSEIRDNIASAPYYQTDVQRQDLTHPDPAEPPSYASLENVTPHVPHVEPPVNGNTSYISGTSPYQPVSQRVPRNGNISDEEEEYQPPPPSYEMAIHYRDVYNVSESQPTPV